MVVERRGGEGGRLIAWDVIDNAPFCRRRPTNACTGVSYRATQSATCTWQALAIVRNSMNTYTSYVVDRSCEDRYSWRWRVCEQELFFSVDAHIRYYCSFGRVSPPAAAAALLLTS